MILKQVCSVLKVRQDQVTSKSRKPHLVEARQITAYLMRNKNTLKEIANKLNQAHPTVFYSINKIEDLISIKDSRITQILEMYNDTTRENTRKKRFS